MRFSRSTITFAPARPARIPMRCAAASSSKEPIRAPAPRRRTTPLPNRTATIAVHGSSLGWRSRTTRSAPTVNSVALSRAARGTYMMNDSIVPTRIENSTLKKTAVKAVASTRIASYREVRTANRSRGQSTSPAAVTSRIPASAAVGI